MESPVVAAKAAFSPGKIIALAFGLLVLFAILDLLNLTDWILYPITNARNKYSKASAAFIPFVAPIALGAMSLGAFALGA